MSPLRSYMDSFATRFFPAGRGRGLANSSRSGRRLPLVQVNKSHVNIPLMNGPLSQAVGPWAFEGDGQNVGQENFEGQPMQKQTGPGIVHSLHRKQQSECFAYMRSILKWSMMAMSKWWPSFNFTFFRISGKNPILPRLSLLISSSPSKSYQINSWTITSMTSTWLSKWVDCMIDYNY